MSHPSLVVLGYSEAGMFVRHAPKRRVVGLISIHGRREFGVELDVERRLDLLFDDVDVAQPDDILAMQRAVSRQRWAEQNGLLEKAPQRCDAESIIAFALGFLDRLESEIVLCHCGAGLSRAPAAALICLAVWRGEGAEISCVGEILRLRPSAVPHTGLVRFADELLGRHGRLIDALAAAMRR